MTFPLLGGLDWSDKLVLTLTHTVPSIIFLSDPWLRLLVKTFTECDVKMNDVDQGFVPTNDSEVSIYRDLHYRN